MLLYIGVRLFMQQMYKNQIKQTKKSSYLFHNPLKIGLFENANFLRTHFQCRKVRYSYICHIK